MSINIEDCANSMREPKVKDIRALSTIKDDAEITIEINPGTVDENKLKDYMESGINRLSIGLQSTNNDLLKS